MKQYFIGVNVHKKELLLRLLDAGATLMFHHHWATITLNESYGFWDGEWMVYTVVHDESEIQKIELFLQLHQRRTDGFRFKIVPLDDFHKMLEGRS